MEIYSFKVIFVYFKQDFAVKKKENQRGASERAYRGQKRMGSFCVAAKACLT